MFEVGLRTIPAGFERVKEERREKQRGGGGRSTEMGRRGQKRMNFWRFFSWQLRTRSKNVVWVVRVRLTKIMMFVTRAGAAVVAGATPTLEPIPSMISK